MGGKGSGGARVGAGRKPKTEAERALSGFAGKRQTSKQKAAARKQAAGVLALPVLAPPADLTGRARAIWVELAPLAAERRTLTSVEMPAFAELCRYKAVQEALFAIITSTHLEGDAPPPDTPISLFLLDPNQRLTQHRAYSQRVEQAMVRFRLAPMGKEVVPAEAAVDEWAQFDADGPLQ